MKQDELTQSVKRKSRGGKRLLSMALAISIVSTMLPTASFPAKADTPIGVSSAEVETVCENHKEHDEGCGYVEAVEGAPCSHLNEDGTYSCAPMKDSGEASPNDAEEAYVCNHTDGCGYIEAAEGKPCTHVCELCKEVADAGTCVCGVLCTEDAINPDCPVCSAEGADLAKACKGEILKLVPLMSPDAAVEEQFTLTPGGTYWFDLSGVGIPGTVNEGNDYGAVSVPDPTLKYVPFTYAGTVNAYVLTPASAGVLRSSSEYASKATDPTAQYGYVYDHSLFVADYNVTHTVSWDELSPADGDNLIFGTSYANGGVNYTLRAPSEGDHSSSETNNPGFPENNEWRAVLDKGDYIKNWRGIYSWGQDTHLQSETYRTDSGNNPAVFSYYCQSSEKYDFIGYRPVLEVLNPDALSPNELRTATLNLNGGKLATGEKYTGETIDTMNIVYTGDTFTAPSDTGLTAPAGMTFADWKGDDGTNYAADTVVPNTVKTLTAQWREKTPDEEFPGLTVGETYWFDLMTNSDITSFPGTVNAALPDTTLHYVPFTYAGTVNAYSRTSKGVSTDENVIPSDHSLFIADYTVTHTVQWSQLDNASLLFNGKLCRNGGVAYTLRAPSVGSSYTGDDPNRIGIPSTNEWDQILDKGVEIRNWSERFSWGQDDYSAINSYHPFRGVDSVRYWSYHSQSNYQDEDVGFRPVLEVFDTVEFPKNLKAATLDLNGGSLTTGEGYAGDVINTINIVYNGKTFPAPAAGQFTRPDGNSGSYFVWQGNDGNVYAPGDSVPTAVTKLTALWHEIGPVTESAISGVTAPAAGATPVTTVTETEQYTGTVAWSPSHTTFGDETVYTATITLSPKPGYTLEGVDANFFTVADATSVTNDTNSGVVMAVFPATGVSTYSVTLDKAETHRFSGQPVGYGVQPPLTVTVTNSGNRPTRELTVALSGMNSSNFTLDKTAISSIAAGETDTFTVTPNTGLAAGDYTATVTVSGDHNISAGFDVSFAVTQPTALVENIVGLPTGMDTHSVLTLTGKVLPEGIETPITWSIVSQDTGVGASLTGDQLTTAGNGKVTLSATVANGKLNADGTGLEDFVKEFTVTAAGGKRIMYVEQDGNNNKFLTVTSNLSGAPQASPILTLAGDFTGSGDSYTFSAGQSLQLSPAVIAKIGSGGSVTVTRSGDAVTIIGKGTDLIAPGFTFYQPKNASNSWKMVLEAGKSYLLGEELPTVTYDPEENKASFGLNVPALSATLNGASFDGAKISFTGTIKAHDPIDIGKIDITKLEMISDGSGAYKNSGVIAEGNVDIFGIPMMEVEAGAEGYINTFPGQREYTFSVVADFNILDVEGKLSLKELKSSGKLFPDAFYFYAGSSAVGIPIIPALPVAELNGAGGGFSGLADTINGDYRGGLIPFSIKITGSASVLKILEANKASITVGLTQFRLETSAIKILGIDIIRDMYVGVSLDYIDKAVGGEVYSGYLFNGEAGIKVLVVPAATFIEAGGSVSLSLFTGKNAGNTKQHLSLDFLGNIYGRIQIPKFVWFIPKIKLGSAELTVGLGGSTTYNTGASVGQAMKNITGNGSIDAKVKVLFVKVKIHYAFGDTKPGVGKRSLIPDNPFAFSQQVYDENGQLVGTVTVGDNFYLLGGSDQPTVRGRAASPVTVTQNGQETTIHTAIDMSGNVIQIVPGAALTDEAWAAFCDSITVTKPDGSTYVLNKMAEITDGLEDETGNDLTEEGKNFFPMSEEDESGQLMRSIVLRLSSETGAWKVSSGATTSYTLTAIGVEPLPELDDGGMSLSGGTVNYRIIDGNTEDRYIVKTFLSTDEGKAEVVVAESEVMQGDEVLTGSLSFDLNRTDLRPGNYYVTTVLYKEAQEGYQVEDIHSFTSPVSVTNSAAPDAATNFTLSDAGNEMLIASWNAAASGNAADGYIVTVYEQQDGVWADTGYAFQADKAQGNSGSFAVALAPTISDTLKTGTEYRFGLSPYVVKSIDGLSDKARVGEDGGMNAGSGTASTMIYGKEVFATATIRKATPPEITLAMGSQTYTGGELAEFYAGASETTLTVTATGATGITVTRVDSVEEQQVATANTATASVDISALVGAPTLKIEAVNSQGDVAARYCTVYRDDTPPVLQVDDADSAIDAPNGNFTLTGKTEAGATLTLTGATGSAVASQDGSFELYGSITTSGTVTATATDAASNSSTPITLTIERRDVTLPLDTTPPTAAILLDGKPLAGGGTPYFNAPVTLNFTGEDEAGLQKVEYAVSSNSAAPESITQWTSGSSLTLSAEGEYYVYVKVTDLAGNVGYAYSPEIVVDKTAPSITGVEANTAYNGSVSFTVSDDHLNTVTVNGAATTHYTLSVAETPYTIVAADRAGNKTTLSGIQVQTKTNATDPSDPDSPPQSAGISLMGWVYGETAKTPVITNPNNAEKTIMYKLRSAADSTYSTAVPTKPGDYRVRLQLAATADSANQEVFYDFSIARKMLTITDGTLAVSKVYDSDTAIKLDTVSGALAFDKVMNDNVSVEVTAGNYADAGVGTGKTVYLTLSLSGADSDNYQLAGTSYIFNGAAITADNSPLTGTVTISGDLKYGATLTAAVSGQQSDAALSYQWKRGTTEIGTGTTYITVADDIGKTLACEVSATNHTGTLTATTTKTIAKADGPAAPSLTPTQPSTIGGTGSIPMTFEHEYSSDNGATWTAATDTAELAAGTYYVRLKETTTHEAGAVQIIVLIAFTGTQETTPSAAFNATGTDTGTLSNVTSGMTYQIDNNTAVAITGTSVDLTNLSACSISVVKKGNGTTTTDSVPQIITVTRGGAVNGVAATNCTTASNNDGSLTGVTTAMEFKKSDGNDWEDGAGTDILSLTPGTYYVRVKSAGTVLTGPQSTFIVAAYSPTPTYSVSLSQTGIYPFAGATVGYGAQTPLTVTVSNIGNQTTGILSAALSGANAGSFTLSKTSISSIAVGGTDTFTVTPNIGLSEGTYTATVTVSGVNSISASFDMSFTVAAATLTDAQKVTAAKAAIETAINALTVTNATTEQELLTAMQNAALYGVAVTWDNANGFSKTEATEVAAGSITGTMKLTLNSVYDTVTINKTIAILPSASCFITFNANGGSVTPSSAVTGADGKLAFLPTPARSGSYSFKGWYTASSGGTAVTTATMFRSDCTIYAQWAYTGSGGSSSSGGSNNNSSIITVTPFVPESPNTPTQGEIKLDGKIDGGVVTVTVTDKNIVDTYEKAVAEARKNGSEQNGITIVLHVGTGGKAVNAVTVNLPKTAQEAIIAKKIVNTIVAVDQPDIVIGMDLAAVRSIDEQAKSDVNITAALGDNSKLTSAAKTAIGTRPVFDLKVSTTSGKVANSFGAGSVSVAIPYIFAAGEKAGNVQAVYLDGSGKVQWLTSSVYDSVNSVLRFSTNHFSTYGVGYKQDAPAFTDIDGHWAKDDIQFVVNRGLLAGTGATTFSPNTAITHGMFVTALGRLANADISGYKQSILPDTKAAPYYMGYIEWASKNGIVSGSTDGKFNPAASITREQMAVIVSNYAKAIGFTTPKVHAENTFADSTKISTYAKEAVKQMQMAGVLAGKGGNVFDPQGITTRAEASAILRRFVELSISSDTMQGWTMNDSGQWMYYQDGKPITGKKDIDGAAYTFDPYGVTADIPRNLRYTIYTVQKGDSFWLIAHKCGCSMNELERLNNKSRFDIIYPGDMLRVPEK